MSMNTHIESIDKKRAQLKAHIHAEAQRPSPNFELIHQLKYENLKLKEEKCQCLESLKKMAA